MSTNRRKRRIVLALVLLLVLPVWFAYREFRQARLDHALIVAINAGYNKKALEALMEGASGEASETGAPPTFPQALLHLWEHLRHRTVPPTSQPHQDSLAPPNTPGVKRQTVRAVVVPAQPEPVASPPALLLL